MRSANEEIKNINSTQWLWRVFNLGWPRGHEEGNNDWGNWMLISEEDACRLASEDTSNVYEFVPYLPTNPVIASA